jgi:asparagine synthase (glutamine-hydrolysing)
MPGIVGLITKTPGERAEQQVLRMLDTIRHEPFYVTGKWCDGSMGVYVGWAARQGSFSDGMPLSNEQGNAVLIFSGEDHPESGTTARLKERGHTLGTEGPSYLVHLYEDDPSFPAVLNGWFHGLLVDRARNTATVFNDRYGLHRLYYHEAKDGFYFAAEAKAILAVRPELRRIEPRSLGEYISVGCVLENRTLFEGIHVLPPASAWRFRNCSVESKATYFDPKEWEQQAPLEPEVYYKELREVFSRNLPRYFNGKQRIGMSLTGGLDTRAIMAWHKPSPGSLPCYTFGGTYRECRDVLVAREVARACGQSHQVIRSGREFISSFPHYAERTVYLTDGCADVSCSPVLYGCQKAREIAPVRMTGNYGDQVLRGLRMFKPTAPAPGLFASELLPHLAEARETYSKIADTHPLSFAAFRQAPWHHYGLLALEETQLTMRSPFLDNDVVRITFRAPASVAKNNDLRIRLIADGNQALQQIPTDMGVGGRFETLPGALLRRYQTLTFKAEYAYDHGMPQWMAKADHALSLLHLERLFLGRHKYYHFRVWYRDRLSKYVQEILLDPRSLSRPYLERRGVEAIVRDHLKGNRNYTYEIHKLLTIELLHRLFIDAKCARATN